MSETEELIDTPKLIRWLEGLAERQVTSSGSRATFVSDMYFEASSRLSSLQEENNRLQSRILELEEALRDFLKCARCDPRMDGKQVFSTMNASEFGRVWMKHQNTLSKESKE